MADEAGAAQEASAAPVAVDLRGAAAHTPVHAAPAPARRRVVVRRGRREDAAVAVPQDDEEAAAPPLDAMPRDEEAAAPPPVRRSGGDGTRRKRLTRFITLLITTCLSAAIATTWYRSATYLEDTISFAGGWPLHVKVGGCDVDVKPGSANKVETRTWLARWVYPSYDYRSGANKPWRVDVVNGEGCHNAPGFSCQDTCLVTVTVATPPSTLTLRSGADVGHYQKLRIEGVELDALDVSGSIDVHINSAVLAGKTRVTSARGDIRVVDTECGDAAEDCWLKCTTGSVYYAESRDLNQLVVNYRYVNMRSCFALPDSVLHTSGKLPHATAFKVAKHYDQDGNGKITQEEFDVGVKKLGACLGGACPLYSWSSAPKPLGTSAFHAALVAANYSELQPFTYRTLAIDRKSGVLGSNRSIRLEASAGEIRVELSNTSTYAQLINNTLRYVAPQDSAPLGARLIPADSEALMKLRDQYGDASTGRQRDVFAVINVAASPGVPADRWIYTSNEVYFELQPPLLDLISYGTVRPRVKRFEVSLNDGEACAAGTTDLDTADQLEEARARVYEELRRTLKPRVQAELVGALVRVKPRNQHNSFPRLAAYARYAPTDSFHEEDYRSVMMRGRGRRALNISLALAALATLWVLIVGVRYLGALHALADRNAVIQMRLRNAEQARRSRATAKDRGVLSNELEDEEGLGIDSDALAWDARRFARYLNAPRWWLSFLDVAVELSTPLLRPIATIDAIVVAPIRRHFVDGRSKFVRMRCQVAHRHGVAPTSTIECDLTMFTQAYRVFCPKKRLKADAFSTIGDVQRYLVATHNLRLRTHKLPRLAGRVWTAVPAFIGDARGLVEHARCFEAAAGVNMILDAATEADGDLQTFLSERTRPALAGATDEDVVIGLVDEPVVLGEGTYGWKPGLLRLYDQWCYETGRPAVSQETLAGEIAAQGVAQSYRVAALGLELRNFPGGGGEGLRLPYAFYLEHVVSVLLHVAVFILPAVWVLWLCLSFQFRHAKLGAYVAADDSKREHAWSPYDADIVKRYFDGHDGAAGGVVSTVVLAYLVVAWVVMVVDYVGDGVPAGTGVWCWARSPALPRPLRRLVKWSFVLCTLPFALLLPFSLILAATWVLGSAILDPNAFLPRTAAFGALVTTLTSVANSLRGAAAAKEASVRDTLRGRLSGCLETWLRDHRDSAVEVASKTNDVAARAREQVAFAQHVAGANDDVQALCAVLDADGSGGISRRELGALVALLDLPTFDHAKVDQVFAYANEDLDAVISPAEFEAAWTWVESEVVDAALEAAGLTDRFVTGAVATALILLLVLLWFIFTLVAAWSDGGSFGAVVESLLIAASAFSVRYLPSSRKVLPDAVVRKGEAKSV